VIRIRAPGRLELTFTKREGFGQEVYDLQADPGKLHDLSAGVEENGILWTKIEQVGDGASYFANNATSLEVLEASGARVRVRHGGQHHTYGLPGMPWNDLGFTQTFTVYATGEAYVDYALIASRDIQLYHFDLIVKSTGAWGPYGQSGAANEAHCVGASGLSVPYQETASPFAMVSSNGSHYFADMLMAMYSGVHNGSYWNEGYQDLDFRCGLFIQDFNPTLATGTSHLPLMLRIAQDMNDAAAGSEYANAYQSPDLAFGVLQGVKVFDDAGDRDGDGFNESEGTYVLRRQPGQPVEFELHAGVPRANPVFKILAWNQPVPPVVYVDDILKLVGTNVYASNASGTLIVQLPGEYAEDVRVRVEGEPVEVPALPALGGVLLAGALVASGARRIRRS